MSIVRVPPVLRDEAGGARQVEASGATVRELLEDLSGRLPEDALLPDALLRRPPRLTAPSLPDAPSDDLAPGAGLGVEDEAAVVRRLRALGYVE